MFSGVIQRGQDAYSCVHVGVRVRVCEGENTDFCLRVQCAGRAGVIQMFVLIYRFRLYPTRARAHACADPSRSVVCFCLLLSRHLLVKGALPLCLHRHPLLERLTVIKWQSCDVKD